MRAGRRSYNSRGCTCAVDMILRPPRGPHLPPPPLQAGPRARTTPVRAQCSRVPGDTQIQIVLNAGHEGAANHGHRYMRMPGVSAAPSPRAWSPVPRRAPYHRASPPHVASMRLLAELPSEGVQVWQAAPTCSPCCKASASVVRCRRVHLSACPCCAAPWRPL